MTRTTTHFDRASEIHISEGEALRDFATVLAHVRSGARIVIDSENSNLPVALISPPVTLITSPVPPKRKISEVIALTSPEILTIHDSW